MNRGRFAVCAAAPARTRRGVPGGHRQRSAANGEDDATERHPGRPRGRGRRAALPPARRHV